MQASEQEGHRQAAVKARTVTEVNDSKTFAKTLYNLQLCELLLWATSSCLLSQFLQHYAHYFLTATHPNPPPPCFFTPRQG